MWKGKYGCGLSEFSPLPGVKREIVEQNISFQYCSVVSLSPASLLVLVFQSKVGVLEKDWTFRLLELGATSFLRLAPQKNEKS